MFRRRFHLAEFGDQAWLAGWWRDAYLDCLNHGLRVGGQFRQLHHVYARWAMRNGFGPVLDLGSGGGGPIETMLEQARTDGSKLPLICLSDLHPSQKHFSELVQKFGTEQLAYQSIPVSACAPNGRGYALRSICATLHHFRPELVSQILHVALSESRSLLIVEPLQRNLRHLLLVLLSGPFAYMAAPFTARHWDWRKFLFTTILPIIPLLVMWDGLVSVLRTYTFEEISALVPPELGKDVTISKHTLPYMGFFGALCIEVTRIK